MKNKFLIFIFLIFASISYKAQATDTLSDAKNFETNKANYIGQPFSKLLNDMTQIQPKTIWATTNFKSKNEVKSSRIKFCDLEESFNVITLEIIWQTPLERSNTKYYQQLHNAFFTNDEKLFYGSKIVKDIKVYR